MPTSTVTRADAGPIVATIMPATRANASAERPIERQRFLMCATSQWFDDSRINADAVHGLSPHSDTGPRSIGRVEVLPHTGATALGPGRALSHD